MPNWVVSMAVGAMLEILNSANERSRWRRAVLKVFREIARQYRDDDEFAAVMSDNLRSQ